MPAKVLLLDFGFTLVDTMKGVYAALSHSCKTAHVEVPPMEDIVPLIRKSSESRRLIDQLFYRQRVPLTPDELLTLQNLYDKFLLEEGCLLFEAYSGIAEATAELIDEGFPVVIASTMAQAVVEKAVKNLNIPVSAVFAASGMEVVKPSPGLFNRVRTQLGLESLHPRECIVVGNSETDIKLARADFRTVGFDQFAKMSAIFATWGNIARDDSCEDLVDLIVAEVGSLCVAIRHLSSKIA